MIIVREFSEVVRQAGFTEYDHVIQALPPNGQSVKKLVEIRGPGAMCTQCLNKDRYSPWIRRLRRPTTSDQNRSCKTTLSIPNTMISSHRPEQAPAPSCNRSRHCSNTHSFDLVQAGSVERVVPALAELSRPILENPLHFRPEVVSDLTR